MIFSIYKVLNSNFKYETNLIFFLLIISTFLEALNIGLLIPVLSAVFSDNQENIFSFLRKFINFNEQNQNLIFLIFILSLIVKNMFSIFCNYKQTLFTSSLKLYLNKLLFRSYLDISYPNFKKKFIANN